MHVMRLCLLSLVLSAFVWGTGGAPNHFVYFTGSNKVPVNGLGVNFTAPSQVCDWWGSGTQECVGATDYYAGYSGPTTYFNLSRVPDGGARARVFGAPAQNLLSSLETECPAGSPCAVSLTYDVSDAAPSGYTVSFSFCADTTSGCVPATQNIDATGSSFSDTGAGTPIATLAWATAINAIPYPAGDGSITISGSVVTGGSVSTVDGTYCASGCANGAMTGATPSSVSFDSGATFNGTISGSTLTVNSTTTGTVLIGQVIAGNGISGTVTILSGTSPTFTLSASLGSIGPEAMTGTNTGTITSAGTITFNQSLQQIAANVNDELNTQVFASGNVQAVTTGSSIATASCQMNAGTLVIGQFMYVTGTQAGCTFPIGSNVNTTETGIVVMAQEMGPPCAVGETSCTESAASRSLTPQSVGPGFAGCAPSVGNFVPSTNCPGNTGGQYTVWTTACCLLAQIGPALSGVGSTANPFIAYWAVFTVGTVTNGGTIATGQTLAANNPAIFLFGGDGVGTTEEYGVCTSTGVQPIGDASCPASGLWSYLGGAAGTVNTYADGSVSCVGTACNGAQFVMPCGFAGQFSGTFVCNSAATSINTISSPVQVTFNTATGPNGLTGRFVLEQSAWASYGGPYGTMSFPTGAGAGYLNLASGSTGTASGGEVWPSELTTTSQVMLSYTAFFTHFVNTVARIATFQTPTDPDAQWAVSWQKNLISAWAAQNGYTYAAIWREATWALVDYPLPTCTPGSSGQITSGSGTIPAKYCQTMTVTACGPNGSASGSFYGGTGACVTLGPVVSSNLGVVNWTYSVGAGGTSNPTTFANSASVLTNSGVVTAPGGANATGSANGAGGIAPTGDEAYGGTPTTGYATEASQNGTTGGATGGPANGYVEFVWGN
jgi:hypothetical protein